MIEISPVFSHTIFVNTDHPSHTHWVVAATRGWGARPKRATFGRYFTEGKLFFNASAPRYRIRSQSSSAHVTAKNAPGNRTRNVLSKRMQRYTGHEGYVR